LISNAARPKPTELHTRAFAAAKASFVRRLISARSFSASAANKCSMKGSVSAPNYFASFSMIQPLSSKRRLWIDAASAVSLLESSLREEGGFLNKRPRPIFNPRQDGPYHSQSRPASIIACASRCGLEKQSS
jgi:hypothetical protein